MQPILDEIIEKTAQLSDAERRELIQLLQEQEKKSNSKNSLSISSVSVNLESNNKNPDPNIEWLKTHSGKYAGNYVALKDGQLVAFGKTIKEADIKAKEKGVKKSLLHYIPAKDEEVWGGW